MIIRRALPTFLLPLCIALALGTHPTSTVLAQDAAAQNTEGLPPEPLEEESSLGEHEGQPPEPPEEEEPAPAEPVELPQEIVLRDYLVIEPVGQYGRTPIYQDKLEYQLAIGKWELPSEGDTIDVRPGVARTWKKAQAGEDGSLNHDALRGGYALAVVESPADRVMILEPRGNSSVYINGVLRTGDAYNNGILRLPVALQKGKNWLLFHVGRGQVSARLVAPQSPALVDLRDVTVPTPIVGESGPHYCAVLVINASSEPLAGAALIASREGAEPIRTNLPTLPPLTTRKVGFHIDGPIPDVDKFDVEVKLVQKQGESDKDLSAQKLTLSTRKPHERHDRTFISQIDGSVQYYCVQPGVRKPDSPQLGLLLTLHGASVEGSGQAAQYSAKDWAHVVAPTNRRPFGFDWEDWGRQDAMEVLELARKQYDCDPRRTWLSGHSMGGHGTWHLGATYPDKFAAIGPSAGWFSFWAYGGMPKFDPPSPMHELLMRGANGSDTLKLMRNFAQQGVYILHGDADDNVPVAQARFMRQQLGGFHPNFSYYEQPGAGHWWGAPCCDWPPMMEFFARQTLPKGEEKKTVEFITVNPGVSSSAWWVAIEAQSKQLDPSKVNITQDREQRRFSGSTDNVARLAIDLSSYEKDKPVHVELDGQKIENIAWPSDTQKIWLARDDKDRWSVVGKPTPDQKGPHRYGTFKDALRNRMLFVYGTTGTPEENAWSLAKARYDAETFWYRGNGSVDVVPDTAFDAESDKDRSVVLYGNADTNGAWPALLSTSPVQIRRDKIVVGPRPELGEDLACLLVRPRPGSDTASVAVVGGTGMPGLRAAGNLKYFVSGVAIPDLMIFGAKTLDQGTSDLRVLGYFGLDWGVDSGEMVWRDLAL